MKYKSSISAFLLLAIATAGAQVASHAPTVFNQGPAKESATPGLVAVGKPVARVNGSVLTDVDLVREEYTIFPYARQHSGIPKDLAPQIRDGALKMIIFEELVYQEALHRKMTVSDVKVQRAEVDFRKQFSTPEEFNALYQSEFHGSHQLLVDKIKRSLLIESLLKLEVENKSTPTPAEIRASYDSNPARYQHPESYTFQTISILPPPNATQDQLKEGHARAEHAMQKAKAAKTSEEFGLLAEKLSDDDYRVVMGQHKPVSKEELTPQVSKALLTMKPGDISDIIQIDQAYTIVRLQVHTPAGKTKFEEVRAQLEKDLQLSKKNQLRIALDKALRQNAKIEEL